MATAYVSFGKMATNDGDQQGPVIRGAPSLTETVTTSATSAQSSAAPSTGIVIIYSDTAHYVTVGDNPTATASNGWYVPANQLFDIKVKAGEKLAFITV